MLSEPFYIFITDYIETVPCISMTCYRATLTYAQDLRNTVCQRYKRKKEGGRSFAVSCAKLWNKLPSELRKKKSVLC